LAFEIKLKRGIWLDWKANEFSPFSFSQKTASLFKGKIFSVKRRETERGQTRILAGFHGLISKNYILSKRAK
jgi:hypothetical protein